MIRVNWGDVTLNTDNIYHVFRKVNTVSFDIVAKPGDHYDISDEGIYIVAPRAYGEEVTDKQREFAVLLIVAEKLGYTEHQDTSIADLMRFLENNLERISA